MQNISRFYIGQKSPSIFRKKFWNDLDIFLELYKITRVPQKYAKYSFPRKIALITVKDLFPVVCES